MWVYKDKLQIFKETKYKPIGIAVVTLSYNDEIFSQRKISFVSNAIDVIVDTIK